MSTFSPAMLQAMGSMMMMAPNASTPSPELQQQIDSAQPGTPLHSAGQILAQSPSSQTPVVNPQSLAEGKIDATAPGVNAATALGEVGQNTQNVQASQKEALGAAYSSAKSATSAEQNKVGAQRQEADVVAPLYAEHAAKLLQYDTDFSNAQQSIKLKATEAFTNYLQATKNYSTMHVHSWWSEANTGAQILGVISQGLAGALQGLTGNLGSETPLDRIIRTDVERQKFNIQQAGDVASKYENQYHLLTQQLNSEVLAEQALYSTAYESTANRVAATLKASGAGPGTAAFKYGQALIQDCQAKQAAYIANAKVQTMGMTSTSVLGDANLRAQFESMWGQQTTAAAGRAAAYKAKVGIPGVAGAEGLPESDRQNLAPQVREVRSGIVQADDAAKLLDDVAAGNLTLRQAQPRLQQILGQMTLSQHRAEDIKRVNASSGELVGAITGGESTMRDWVDSILPGMDGTSRGRSPEQRAAMFRSFGNELRRSLQRDVGGYLVEGKRLRYDGSLDAATIRAEENNAAGLPEETR